MLGANLGLLLYAEVSVMKNLFTPGLDDCQIGSEICCHNGARINKIGCRASYHTLFALPWLLGEILLMMKYLLYTCNLKILWPEMLRLVQENH